jgi:hypothetical protein
VFCPLQNRGENAAKIIDDDFVDEGPLDNEDDDGGDGEVVQVSTSACPRDSRK